MNARTQAHQPAADKAGLRVRDRRFGRRFDGSSVRSSGDNASPDLASDPIAAAWFTALSASFPRGEAMFIEAVRAHREGTPEPLASQIRDFIRQEVHHSREHLAFNRAAEAAGFDLAQVDNRVAQMVSETQAQPAIVQLAVTMALEHFTAMFAHLFLTDPDSIGSAGMGGRDLWQWHAVEEIEHKGVAYDTWIHATRNWPARRRWIMRSAVMVQVSFHFIRNRSEDALELLAQRGIIGWRARWRLFAYLTFRPGMLRRIVPQWLAFFRPGFHPWDHDDSALIRAYDRNQPDGAPSTRS